MTHTTEHLEQMLADATPGDLVFVHLGTRRDHANGNDFCYIRTADQCGDDTAIATVHNGDNGMDAMIANAVLFTSAPSIAAELIAARKRIAELEAGLTFYAESHSQNPNEGPWGISSTDYGTRARAALGDAQ